MDNCQPLLKFGANFRLGKLGFERIRARIKGRIACHPETCGVIAEVVSRCPGDHLEIGVLFGGTTALAAMLKHTGRVVAVDPLDGYYGQKLDIEAGITPTPEVFWENMDIFGVREKVELVQGLSDPYPVAPERRFDTCLIDGDHSFKGALADWMNVKDKVDRYIIFDNIDNEHPGLVKVFKLACADPDWLPICIYDICGVLERVNH